jgi:hypothetical protein
MKNNKNFAYPKKDLEIKKNLLVLRDSAIALNYGRLKNDQRLQITMPSNIVKIVDRLFPGEERNKIFTKAIIEFLSREIQTNYKFDATDLLRDEQGEMDEMWDYLDKLSGRKNMK